MVNAGAGLLGCPFCGAELGTIAPYCGSCGASLVAQPPSGDEELSTVRLARRLAINRRKSDDESLVVWRGGDAATGRERSQGNAPANDPGLTFDPIKVGPDTCSGCESTAVFVVGGQAAIYSLEGCDDDWCFYENPQGIV
jgi:uncharacterized protein (UPF0212 family)